DSAGDYGNEKETGQGIQSALNQGIVKREDIFVTSKLWNTCHARQHVRPALERTLSDLGLTYLDLYLIHFPVSLKHVPFEERYPAGWFYNPEQQEIVQEHVPIQETWQAMEELVDAGLVKNIGVSNFPKRLINEILTYARVRPAVLQIEHHPYLTQEDLVAYAKGENMAITGYSTFGGNSYVELSEKARNSPNLLTNDLITELASKYKKSPGQILLRWSVQRGIAVVPKTSKAERLKENINIFNFELSEDDIKRISSLNRNLRFNEIENVTVYV
ncbi:9723_t:CDS:2, partial [Paraglomus occultum]